MSPTHEPTIACRLPQPIVIEVEKSSSNASTELLPVLGSEKITHGSPLIVVTERVPAKNHPTCKTQHEAARSQKSESEERACPRQEPALPSAKETTIELPSLSKEHTPDVGVPVAIPDQVQSSKPSAWTRFREGLSHDPLNEPEFVEAYNDWKKRNRKERYDRRRAWVRAHGTKLGRILRLVNKKQSDEAWAAYQEKLAYMED